MDQADILRHVSNALSQFMTLTLPPLMAALLAGLVAGPGVWRVVAGAWPVVHVQAPWPVLVVAGFLVGFGTRMGSGCTSGHGVMGLARLSPRSLVAVCCFLGTGVLVASLFHLAGWR